MTQFQADPGDNGVFKQSFLQQLVSIHFPSQGILTVEASGSPDNDIVFGVWSWAANSKAPRIDPPASFVLPAKYEFLPIVPFDYTQNLNVKSGKGFATPGYVITKQIQKQNYAWGTPTTDEGSTRFGLGFFNLDLLNKNGIFSMVVAVGGPDDFSPPWSARFVLWPQSTTDFTLNVRNSQILSLEGSLSFVSLNENFNLQHNSINVKTTSKTVTAVLGGGI